MNDNLLDAALAYAARGWAVFPLSPGDRLPVISQKKGGRGVYDATTDPKQIRAWWEQWPNANIGVAAAASGLLLVDVDNKNGRDGFTSWEVVRHTYGSFDDTTPHVWTPNGGKHLYFRADGETLRNTNDELGPGIETKANGAYLVAPPSRLADGRTYTWDERLGLDQIELAPVPEPLRRLLAPKVKPTTPASPPARLPTGGGYAAAALRNELDTLGRAVEGNRNNALNKAALCLGELVAGGELARGEVEQDLLDVALRIGLGEREAVATIKSGLDAGARNPRTAPEPERRPVSIYRDAPEEPEWMRAAPEAGYILGGDGEPMPTATGKPVKANKETPTLHFVSLRELLTTEWPEPLYIVKDMLPEGLTNVAGKSKLGKSWLCLQLGFAVAAGGVFLGQRVDAGPVCYAALEDSFPWLYDRAEKQRMREAIDAPLDFLDIDSIRDVRNGALLPVIRSGKYRLVVIDTLSRALTGDQNDTGDMTAALSTYQAAALAAHCAVIFVDHHNKLGSGVIADGADPDPLLNLLGATGKGAVADGIWGLYKQPAGRRGALLAITGRRVPEQRLTIVKDPITHVWQLDQSTQAAVNMTPERAEILAAVEELGAATSSEVAKHTGQNRGNAHKRLQDLVNLGLLTLDGKQYKLPIGGDDDDNN